VEFANGVRRRGLLLRGSAFLGGLLGQLGLGVGMNEVVLVPGRGARREDGIPNDGFRGGFLGAGGGVDGLEVDKDLLRVPVEEGAEVCIEELVLLVQCLAAA
jgi:hypothetical protein